jgi:hypothetical protein
MSATPEQVARQAANFASDWHQQLSAYREASNLVKTDDEHDALDSRLRDAAAAILAEPARTLDDIIVHAAITVEWNTPDINDRVDVRSVAALAQGVLSLAGLKFDADGRVFAA